MAKAIDAKEMIKSSWQYLSDNIQKLWPLALLFGLPSILTSFSSDKHQSVPDFHSFKDFSSYTESTLGVPFATFSLLAVLFLLVWVIYTAIVQGGGIHTLLSSLRGKKTDFSVGHVVKAGNKTMAKIIGLGLAVGLIIFAGALLLVIPGLIAFFLLSLSFHFLVDKDLSVRESMTASFQVIKNNAGSVASVYFGLFLVTIVFSIVMAVFFGADNIVARLISAAAGGGLSLFSLVVATKLYLALQAKSEHIK